jgi:hypothetical protein
MLFVSKLNIYLKNYFFHNELEKKIVLNIVER